MGFEERRKAFLANVGQEEKVKPVNDFETRRAQFLQNVGGQNPPAVKTQATAPLAPERDEMDASGFTHSFGKFPINSRPTTPPTTEDAYMAQITENAQRANAANPTPTINGKAIKAGLGGFAEGAQNAINQLWYIAQDMVKLQMSQEASSDMALSGLLDAVGYSGFDSSESERIAKEASEAETKTLTNFADKYNANIYREAKDASNAERTAMNAARFVGRLGFDLIPGMRYLTVPGEARKAAMEDYKSQRAIADEFGMQITSRTPAQEDADAALRGYAALSGVFLGSEAAKAVGNAGLKLLREMNSAGMTGIINTGADAVGQQNRIIPNVLLGGASGLGYAAGQTGTEEIYKALTDENYTPNWTEIGTSAAAAFAFGAISSAIRTWKISGENKVRMEQINEQIRSSYEQWQNATTPEQKAKYAANTMANANVLRHELNELHIPGADRQVRDTADFLWSIEQEMMGYAEVYNAANTEPAAAFGGGAVPSIPEAADTLVPLQNPGPTSTPVEPVTEPVIAAAAGAANAAVSPETNDALTRIATEMAAEQLGAAEDAEPVDVLPGRLDDLTPETIKAPRPAQQAPVLPAPQPTAVQDRPAAREDTRDASEKEPAQTPAEAVTEETRETPRPAQQATTDAQTPTTDAKTALRESAQRGGMGRHGVEAIAEFYSGEDVSTFYGDFARAYTAGREGREIGTASAAEKGAWTAGRMDAIEGERAGNTAANEHGSDKAITAGQYSFRVVPSGEGYALRITDTNSGETQELTGYTTEEEAYSEAEGLRQYLESGRLEGYNGDTTTKEGAEYGGGAESVRPGSAGIYAQRTGQQTGAVQAGAEGTGRQRGAAAQTGREGKGNLETVSRRIVRAEEVIPGAEPGQKLVVLDGPENADQQEGYALAKKNGIQSVTPFEGGVLAREPGVIGEKRAFQYGGRIGAQVNNEEITFANLVRHEIAEYLISHGRMSVDSALNAADVDSRLLDAAVDFYYDCLRPKDRQLSSEEAAAIREDARRELVCDAGDHINQLRYDVEHGALTGEYYRNMADLLDTVLDAVHAAESDLTDGAFELSGQTDEIVGAEAEGSTESGTRTHYSSKRDVLALTGIDWVGKNTSIKQQLQRHADELNSMQPVAEVNYAGIRLEDLPDFLLNEVGKIGGKRMTRDGITFDFDGKSAEDIKAHAYENENRAAAMASPLVAKYGRLISGQKQHENTPKASLTYAAPVIINGARVNVGVAVHFDANGHPYAVNVGVDGGKKFIVDMTKAPAEGGSSVKRIVSRTNLPKADASEETISRPDEKSKNNFSSKLSNEQQNSTHDSTGRGLSPQQQAFFADSKAVDADGNLLTLYHGTTAYGEITRFKKGTHGWLGPGIYVTTRQSDAQRYADAYGPGNGTVYELYANVTNPLVVTSSNPVPDILRAAYGKDSIYQTRSAKQANDPNIITPTDIKKLQAKGYDGIRWDFGRSTEISVFASEQLKRTDNETPTGSPDIRFSSKLRREDIENARQKRNEGGVRGELARYQPMDTEYSEEERRQSNSGRGVRGTSQKSRGRGVRYEDLTENEKAFAHTLLFDPIDNSEQYRSVYRGYPVTELEEHLYNAFVNNTTEFQNLCKRIPWFKQGAETLRAYFNGETPADGEIRHIDNMGSDLSDGQYEFFKDSKVKDTFGRLKMMFRGGRTDIRVFDRRKSRHSNLYGRGFYFTDSISHSQEFGEPRAYYLNIVNPLMPRQHKITRAQMRKFLKAVAENEDYGLENYGYGATVDSILNSIFGKGDFEMLQDVSATAIGDLVQAVEFFNEVNGTKYDGFILPTETVVFQSEQIKKITNLTPTVNPDVNYSSKLTAENELRRQNLRLQEQLEEAKKQTERTVHPEPRKADVDAVARDFVKRYGSSIKGADISGAVGDLAADIFSGDTTFVGIKEKAAQIAREIVDNAEELQSPDMDSYRQIQAQLRQPIIISVRDANDVSPEWGAWRNAHRGRVNVSINGKGTPVDVMYAQLSEAYPGYFPEDITHPADQLIQMVDVMDSLAPTMENPFSRDMAEAIEYCANDLIVSISGMMAQAPTFADRVARELAEAKAKGKVALEKLREQQAEKLSDIQRRNAEKTREALRRVREQRDEKIAALKEHYAEQKAKSSEKRKAGALRAKITRHVKKLSTELLRPNDKRHIPEQLRGPVARLLESINLESGFDTVEENGKIRRVERGTGMATKRTQAFADLRKAYVNIGDAMSIDPDLLGDGGEPGLLDDVIAMADKPLANMTSTELETVWNTVRAVEASIRSWNELFTAGRWETVSAMADAMRAENRGKNTKVQLRGVLGKGQNLLSLDMLTPETYFAYLGDTGRTMFRMLRNAHDQQIRLWDEAIKYVEDIIGDYDIREAEKRTVKITIGGQTVEVTRAQLMELYVLMRREQALAHLQGGVLFTPVQKGIRRITMADAVRLNTLEDLAEATKNLTAEEVRIAEALQEFLSVTASDWGNKASMAVYGYKKFGEENYWPIKVNRHELQSTIEGETGQRSVKNYGFAKALTPNAKNSVIIGSIFDTFSNHVAEMATYSAYLEATEDLMRVFNYQFPNDTGTVEGIIETVHGTGGTRYFMNLMTQLAFGVKGENIGTEYMGGLVGNYKGSAIGANLRVFLQQPTAIVRAAEMINPAYLISGLKDPISGWKKAEKYAPIALWKSWGYFDMAAGRSLKSLMFDSDTKLQKVNSALMAPAGWMDSLAWGQLWNACEMEVKADIKSGKRDLTPGTEAFYNAVADRFTEIIDHTQVVDGILQRSQIMRSADGVAKMATSFMAEPTKQYNEMVSAIYEVRNSQSKAARSKAMKHLARTTVALVAASALNAVVKSLVDGIRDDDRSKKYWERVIAAIPKNLKDELNPLSYIPWLRDISSLIEGYSVDRMDMETIGNLVSSSKALIKALGGEGTKSVGNAMSTLLAEAARLLGAPVANLKRDLLSIANTIGVETDNWVFLYGMDKLLYPIRDANNTRYYNTLWSAYKSGDKEQYQMLYRQMIRDGFDEKKIKSAMESRMKNEQGVSSVKDLDERWEAP